jgi:hypothetical protein
MSTQISLLCHLCSAIEAFSRLPATETSRAPVHETGALTMNAAKALIPELIRRGNIENGLCTAMYSKSAELIAEFPPAPYGTYTLSGNLANAHIWAKTIDPDIIMMLSSRGLFLNNILSTLLPRAFQEKDDRLREWAMTYLPSKTGDFNMVNYLSPGLIRKRPEFTEDLLCKAVNNNPLGASLALEKFVEHFDGLQAVLLLHAGAEFHSTTSLKIRDRIEKLSNHQKLSVMRPSTAAFATDKDAVRAAQHLLDL